MKNNYDLILNFETEDGKPLSEETIENIFYHANYVAQTMAKFNNIRVWKAIISQGVDSQRISQFIEYSELASDKE